MTAENYYLNRGFVKVRDRFRRDSFRWVPKEDCVLHNGENIQKIDYAMRVYGASKVEAMIKEECNSMGDIFIPKDSKKARETIEMIFNLALTPSKINEE